MIPRDVIDPRTATPCRTVIFAEDLLIEANYLGFITVRSTSNGEIESRFLAQTALVETLRYSPVRRQLLLVGAGFEGYRDFGAVKLFDIPSGRRAGELRGHWDDITDVCVFPDDQDRAASIGLDRRLVIHKIGQLEPVWIWEGYEDYLNMCAARPGTGGEVAVAGASPWTYVISTKGQSVIAKLDTPGDSNGLIWSHDGNTLIVGDDHGVLKYFDATKSWALVKEVQLGGAVKKTVVDPLTNGQHAIAACYDGQIWQFPLSHASNEKPRVVVARTPGLWGINVDATSTHLAAPSFKNRAFLFKRDRSGIASGLVGKPPQDTFGANSLAASPDGSVIVSSHDDGRLRIRRTVDGALLQVGERHTESLLMGVSIDPRGDVIAAVDFYGDVWIYDLRSLEVRSKLTLPFGPGISVSFDESGRYLAVGGYRWDAYVLERDEGCRELFKIKQQLQGPNKGVAKQILFSKNSDIYLASGDGTAVRFAFNSGLWQVATHFRGDPQMELCNGVCVNTRAKIAYVVSRDQTVRGFHIESGEEVRRGYAHTRSVKTVAYSEQFERVVTGSYDRTILIWDENTLQPVVPPIRLANSGVSSVIVVEDAIYAVSFDGVIGAWGILRGELRWFKDSHAHSLNE